MAPWKLVEHPVFDRSVLDRLAAQARGHGDHALVADVLDESLRSIDLCCEELRRALVERDRARLRSVAHRLKSVLRQMGAARMGHEAAETERLALALDEQAFDHAAATLALHDATAEALRAHLATLATLVR
jgi:HPt (histidine-containing phosphotransfer) domain-containing protein